MSRHLRYELRALLKRLGLTAIFVTHNMEEASHLCDRLIIVDHGKILVDGSPEDLIASSTS